MEVTVYTAAYRRHPCPAMVGAYNALRITCSSRPHRRASGRDELKHPMPRSRAPEYAAAVWCMRPLYRGPGYIVTAGIRLRRVPLPAQTPGSGSRITRIVPDFAARLGDFFRYREGQVRTCSMVDT